MSIMALTTDTSSPSHFAILKIETPAMASRLANVWRIMWGFNQVNFLPDTYSSKGFLKS